MLIYRYIEKYTKLGIFNYINRTVFGDPDNHKDVYEHLKWFSINLVNTFSKIKYTSNISHWFKESSTDCLEQMNMLVRLLELSNVHVVMMKKKLTKRYNIVYEDCDQIVIKN